MSPIHELLSIYRSMRAQGIEAKRALEILRPQIDTLSQPDQADFVRRVREIEERKREGGTGESKPQIKPISQQVPKIDATTVRKAGRTLPLDEATERLKRVEAIACPHCSRPNRLEDAVCFACGAPLQAGAANSTRSFGEQANSRDSFFGRDSVLILQVRDTKNVYKLRPQHYKHDIIIGRADASVQPDIDLSEAGAATLGVSRMHLSLRYDPTHATLSVSDMNTVNGTFINGVQLHPQEVRVLRHGDELRLGRLVITAHFYFAE